MFVILACAGNPTPHSECADPTGPHPISAKPTQWSCSKQALIAPALFGFAIEPDSLNYEYNHYKNCPKEELDFLEDCKPDNKDAGCDGYRGGHAGWDIQTKSVAGDRTADETFYSLTSGEVIAIDKEDLGKIAVYNATDSTTTLYLHAREIDVDVGEAIEVGTRLGIQGNVGLVLDPSDTNTNEHVHIEVRDGYSENASCGAGATIDPINIDPIDYLYEAIQVQ